MAVLDLAGAKRYLQIADSNVDFDEDIQELIDSVVPQIEDHIGGPAENRAVTETVTPVQAWRALPLSYREFVSLTSITIGGTTISLTDVYLASGRVLRRNYDWPFLPYWIKPVVVQYQAGRGASAPPAITRAAKIIVAHLFEPQRGRSGGRGPSANSQTATVMTPGFAFAVPNRALELLTPYAAESGLA